MTPARKLITATDFLSAATLLVLVPVALFVPEKFWPAWCRAYARVVSAIRIPRLRRIVGTLATFQSDTDEERGYRQCIEMMFESRLILVDHNLLRRRQVEVEVTGRHYIDDALRAGKGALLWNTPTAFSDLVVKIGLARERFDLVQLSRPEHGFSESRTGIRVLNPIRTRVEDRYLKNRVEIDSGTERAAMLSLRRVLAGNGIVNITIGSQARRPTTMSLAVGTLPIAVGPIRLAKIAGAPLIPVFSARTGPMQYRVEVSAPLNQDTHDVETILQRYETLLLGYLKACPWQARGLSRLSIPGDDQAD